MASSSSSSSSPSVTSPPSSLNDGRTKKSTKKKKSTLRVLTEILFALLICEMYFYRKLSLTEFEDVERLRSERDGGGGGGESEDDTAERIQKTPRERHQQRPTEMEQRMNEIRRQFQGGGGGEENNRRRRRRPPGNGTADGTQPTEWELANAKRRREREIEKESEKPEYLALLEKHKDVTASSNRTTYQRLKTAKKLARMGVYTGYELDELPPWSQIEDNFGIPFADDNDEGGLANDEPIILGLEYCEAFRNATDPRIIGMGPAGLFSTGTNLINSLTRNNCRGPSNQTGLADKFALIQVPYGKHNPADARFYHQVRAPQVEDRTAILPVVAIRHPYTWMAAMCKHSYQTRWRHVPHQCYKSLFLKNYVKSVPWGFKRYNETHNVTNSYESLAHMWMEWYKPYFLDHQHNQAPRLMVRHEDMVYRPEQVVSRICECVGGTNLNDDPDWNHPNGFYFEEESANRGKGHGKGRSGLLTAVIKYATPLEEFYSRFSGRDKEIMREAFVGEGVPPDLRKIFPAMGYKLFDDTSESTDAEKKRNKAEYIARLKPNETKAFHHQQGWIDGPPPRHKSLRQPIYA